MHLLPPRLVEALFNKKRLLEAGDPRHAEIRTALIIYDGGMQGVCGAAQAVALHALGLGNVFDCVIGGSSGSMIAPYFLAGEKQTKSIASIFYEDLPKRRFISFARFWKVENVDCIISLFRNGQKRLDTEAINRSRSKLLLALTRWHDVQAEFHGGKVLHLLELVRASCAIPWLYPKNVYINTNRYVDSGISFNLETAVLESGATHVLILENQPEKKKGLSYFGQLVLRITPKRVGARYLTSHARHLSEIERLNKNKDLTVGSLWVPANALITSVSMNANALRHAGELALRETLEAFEKPETSVMLL